MNLLNDEVAYDQKLSEHCEKLRKQCISAHPSDNFKKWFKYYYGKYDKADNNSNLYNMRNIIKPIVEAKTRFLLDSNITTAVLPRIQSQEDIEEIKTIDQIASFQNDALNHVLKLNKFDRIKENVAKHGNITGLGIVETTWDSTLSQNFGDVKLSVISPMDFYWDPSAHTVEQMNFCFIRMRMSKFTLKKRFAIKQDGSIDQAMLDKLSQLSPAKQSSTTDQKPKGIVSYQTNETGNLAYIYPSDGMASGTDEIEVWKCYLKDDTTFIPESNNDKDAQAKQELRFKYPFGRMVLYAGNDKNFIVLDDRPIDYPFGFPIDIYNDMETDELQGQGEVEDLVEIQDRINRAFMRLRDLVQKYVSFIGYDPKTTGLRDQDLVNAVGALKIEGLSRYPSSVQVITNNTLSELDNVLKMLQLYEQEAYKVARVNESMISGEKPSGVNSGVMVEALNEPAMIAIRSMQKNFTAMIISVSEKILVLLSIYYNVPRFIRISEGKKFVKIPQRPTPEEMQNIQAQAQAQGIAPREAKDPLGQPLIPRTEVVEKQEDGSMAVIEEIMGDLSLGEYEVEVVAGTEMPRSKTQFAQITQQLAGQGMFGDPNSLEVKEIVLKALDFPNRHAIIQEMKKQQEKAQANAKPPLPPIEKLGLNYKDLSPELRSMLLQQLFGQQIPPEMTLTPGEHVDSADATAQQAVNQDQAQLKQTLGI